MSEKIYCGGRLAPAAQRDAASGNDDPNDPSRRVTVMEHGEEHALDPRLDIHQHSPAGFAWGYRGDGPAQLALAICCECLGEGLGSDPQIYRAFEADYVATWDSEWQITEKEIAVWAASLSLILSQFTAAPRDAPGL